MLAFDSLVVDLIFSSHGPPEPELLLEALGGEEVVGSLKILDPDMQDPRFEMELSPSRPFRRREERRLLVIDDSVAPMREDPQADPIVRMDLSEAKESLIHACEKLGDSVRLARLFALGSWGEAVMVARSAVDLRAWALQAWVLDPTSDVSGRRLSQPLSQEQFEEKLAAYERRLEELSEEQILASLGPASLERRGDWLVLSVLDDSGHWDQQTSRAMEDALASVERFSTFPGAPATPGESAPPSPSQAKPETERPTSQAPAAQPQEPPAPEPGSAAPLTLLDDETRPVFMFPADRFDLEVAATLGKGDWFSVLSKSDADGPTRDLVHEHGAGFVAPLEFLSEVFVDGKPLSKPQFEREAETLEGDVRTMRVHYPRFGPTLLMIFASGRRFVTSEVDRGPTLAALVSQRL